MPHTSTKKPNFYISYIKGIALINIVLIHLIDWSNMSLSVFGLAAKEFFYTGILLFTVTTGSVIVIAYQHRSSLRDIFQRLWYRGGELLFFYYLYNLVKVVVFNFSTQPFYEQFINVGTLTIPNILVFKSFAVPITILSTYAFFLIIAPLLLYVHKKTEYPRATIAILIMGVLLINYATNIPAAGGVFISFLYANGFVLLPIALWLTPFLIGFFLAQVGFEKQKKPLLIVSGLATLVYGISHYIAHASLLPSNFQFPLTPYFIASGLFSMSLMLYAFQYLERAQAVFMKKVLTMIRFLGDNTLHLYIYHWIVIDLTIWIFPSHPGVIWFASPLFFVAYLLLKKKKVVEYYSHQNGYASDMVAEVA